MATNRRLLLHEIFCEILGTRNAYFQPPESVKMNYPAIVYGLDSIENTYANDGVYLSYRKYSVTVIDKVATLPTCRFIRHYEKDNLNHDVFTIFF